MKKKQVQIDIGRGQLALEERRKKEKRGAEKKGEEKKRRRCTKSKSAGGRKFKGNKKYNWIYLKSWKFIYL